MAGKGRLAVAAAGFGLAGALASWNPLAAPFGLLVGITAGILSFLALRRGGGGGGGAGGGGVGGGAPCGGARSPPARWSWRAPPGSGESRPANRWWPARAARRRSDSWTRQERGPALLASALSRSCPAWGRAPRRPGRRRRPGVEASTER